MKHAMIPILIAALGLGACGEPPQQILPSEYQHPLQMVAVDLDLRGLPELVGMTDADAGRMSRIGHTSVSLKALEQGIIRNLDQKNLPGRKVDLLPLHDPRHPAVLAFTVHQGGLHAFRLELAVDAGSRLDTVAHAVIARAPVSDSLWDVRVGSPISHPEGHLILPLITGHAANPRGIIELNPVTLAVIREHLTPTKVSTGVVLPALNVLALGSHAAENGAPLRDDVPGVSDSSAYLIRVDLGGREFAPRYDALVGRGGGVDVRPVNDSTVAVLARSDVPMSVAIYLVGPGQGDLPLPIDTNPGIRRIETANLNRRGSAEILVVMDDGSIQIHDPDSNSQRIIPEVAYGPILMLERVDGTGPGQSPLLLVGSASETRLLDYELNTVARGPANLTISDRLSDDLFLGSLDGKTAVLKMVPDNRAVEELRARWLWGLLVVGLVLASNAVIWQLRGRLRPALPTADFHQYLIMGKSGEESLVDHLVRVRESLEKEADNSTLSVDRLATLSGFRSARELNDAVRAASGETARTLIEQFRLHKASKMLQSTDLTVEEVASRVGFRSHQYFTTRFRKAFGMTPSDFRSR